jgi:hypothetical protein
MQEEDTYVFLKNEMQELSRTLSTFWGVPNQEAAEATLDNNIVYRDLLPGDCVMLITDGVFIPILRSLLDKANFRLHRKQFYLEPWLTEMIANGGYMDGRSCRDLLPDVVDRARHYASRKSRYQDDIAGIAVHLE